MEWIIIWSVVIALSIIIEIESYSFVSAWFAGGGVIALILAMFDKWTSITWAGWMVQVIVFVVISLGLLVGVRPLAKKFVSRTPTVPTNADVHFGKKFKLLSDTKGGRSSIDINDIVWTVQVDGDYKAGDFVILKGLSGNKYIAEGEKKAESLDAENLKGSAPQKTAQKKGEGK